jgi:hypothetical protein
VKAASRWNELACSRHLTNMFNKLNVTSRAAATAYAYQHHLVGRHDQISDHTRITE